jgi:hypothetical protein
MNHKIAVRLYTNPKWGKTYGKGLRHNAMFNGTIDMPTKHLKYLIDLVTFEHWQHTAVTEADMDTLAIVIDHYVSKGIDIESSAHCSNILCSWVKRFDSNMMKPKVGGFVAIDLRTSEIVIAVDDASNAVGFGKQLSMRRCKDPSYGQRSPNFFASNYEVEGSMPIAA